MRYKFLRFPGGKPKAVTLSYDDGCAEDVKLIEILSKYGMKCTFNFSGKGRTRWGVPTDKIKEDIKNGVYEIAVHGEKHRAEGSLRPIEGIQDVLNCRKGLEETYETIIRGMAYPDSGIRLFSNGATYEKVSSYLTELDIVYARSLGEDNDSFELPEDWHNWMPTAHHTNKELMDYIDKFIHLDLTTTYEPLTTPKLFYLWGHTFEFERDDNWDLIERVCQKFSAADDIWYATNIEIYNYVEAYNSLIYSADGNRIYNPTLIDVWFEADRVMYCIKSGETFVINK